MRGESGSACRSSPDGRPRTCGLRDLHRAFRCASMWGRQVFGHVGHRDSARALPDCTPRDTFMWNALGTMRELPGLRHLDRHPYGTGPWNPSVVRSGLWCLPEICGIGELLHASTCHLFRNPIRRILDVDNLLSSPLLHSLLRNELPV